MTIATDKAQETTPARAPACNLPMRKDAPPEDQVAPAPQKNIMETRGGKAVNAGIYYGIGWLGNSTLALFFTYFLNPLDKVARGKQAVTKFIVDKVLRSSGNAALHNKTLDSVRSTVEMLFMMISGVSATLAMTPLLKRRGRMAHKVNQWLGKDTDVLPADMRELHEPKTLEDKIEQEIHKRVNRKHSTGDLWTARAIGMTAIIGGDYVVNRSSRNLEKAGKQSVDTLAWRLGQKIYNAAPKSWMERWTGFFSRHGASIEKLEKNMKEHFGRLKDTEIKFGTHGGAINADRMVIAEQTRLVTKEAGWTMVMAVTLHQLVRLINKHRVKREETKAIAEVTKEGLVPDGYKIVLDKDKMVKLEPTSDKAGKGGSWIEKSAAEKSRIEKPENFVKAVDSSRAALGEQPALG